MEAQRPLQPRTLIALGALLAFLILFPWTAHAQLSPEDQKCVNSINKGLAKVAKAMDGDIATCVKNVGKGKLEGQTPTACLTADNKRKVEKARSKIKTSDCPSPPAFPQLDPNSASIRDKVIVSELELVVAVFGSDLAGVLVVTDKAEPQTKVDAKCQAALAKQLGKCVKAKLGTFIKCKKNELKGKNETATPITSAEELENVCAVGGIPDEKGKIRKDCDVKMTRLFGGGDCQATDWTALFPGCADQAGTAAEIAACMDQRVECKVCRLLNAVDGLTLDCDLFDDGLPNGSCPPPGTCGDGVVNLGEDCDPPGELCGGGCNPQTGICVDFVCDENCGCPEPFCGDGLIDLGEECDDANNIDGDSCSADCLIEFCGDTFPQCNGTCPNPNDVCTNTGAACDCLPPVCGDGVVNGSEQCDPNAPREAWDCPYSFSTPQCDTEGPGLCQCCDNDCGGFGLGCCGPAVGCFIGPPGAGQCLRGPESCEVTEDCPASGQVCEGGECCTGLLAEGCEQNGSPIVPCCAGLECAPIFPAGICCASVGAPCSGVFGCCSGVCGPANVCECAPAGTDCFKNDHCCSGTCTGFKCD